MEFKSNCSLHSDQSTAVFKKMKRAILPDYNIHSTVTVQIKKKRFRNSLNILSDSYPVNSPTIVCA